MPKTGHTQRQWFQDGAINALPVADAEGEDVEGKSMAEALKKFSTGSGAAIGSSLCFWAPLVDITSQHGSLRVFPGSHKAGIVAHSACDGDPSVSLASHVTQTLGRDKIIEAQPGDLVVYSSSLVRSNYAENNGNSIAWCIDFRFDDTSRMNTGSPIVVRSNSNIDREVQSPEEWSELGSEC